VREAVYLDTSGWLAALSPREEGHEAAHQAYQSLVHDAARLVTTNLVVAEMHILLTRRHDPETGLAFLESLYRDPAHEVRFVTRSLEAGAMRQWIRPFADKPLSLADAVGFEVMRTEGITRALAYDRHFQDAGFEMIPTEKGA
jgi:predicted nucleic acid-binding protein